MESVMKSNYKMICEACNKPIKKGDLITRTWHTNGMNLRTIYLSDGSFYTRNTGNKIVHKDCRFSGVWTCYDAARQSMKDEDMTKNCSHYDDFDDYYYSSSYDSLKYYHFDKDPHKYSYGYSE